jgi:hypothetical protein
MFSGLPQQAVERLRLGLALAEQQIALGQPWWRREVAEGE